MARTLEISTIDEGWEIDDPQPLPPPPQPPNPRPPQPPPAPAADVGDAAAQGKRGRFARGTNPATLVRQHGLRRIIAQPGQFTDRAPLPGVPPLPNQSSVVASKVLATFPPESEPARLARMVLADPEHAAEPANAPTGEVQQPPRKSPRTRETSAALHRFGALCYISGNKPSTRPTRKQPTHARIANPGQVANSDGGSRADDDAISHKRPLWKRLFGS